jgi:hypothetical protein
MLISEDLETSYYTKDEDHRKIIEDQEDLYPGIA